MSLQASILSVVQFDQWYKTPTSTRDKEECDSDDGDGSASRESEGKKKAGFEVQSFRFSTLKRWGI